MALTEAEKLSIARKLSTPNKLVTYIDVNDKVTYAAAYITAQVETDIRALLTEWDAANLDSDFVKVDAGPAGFKGHLDPEDQRTRIRRDLAGLLYFTDLHFGGSNWGYNTRS